MNMSLSFFNISQSGSSLNDNTTVYHFDDFFIECTLAFWLMNTIGYAIYLFVVICVMIRLKGLLVCKNYVQILVLSIVLFATEIIYSVYYFYTT